MGWQILHLSQQAHLSLKHGQCAVDFATGDSISLPLDNLSIVVLESLHITLSAALLQKMAANGIAVFVCNETHTPNGVLLPFMQHFCTTKMAFQQIQWSAPFRSRIWQQIIKSKIKGQSAVLRQVGFTEAAEKLKLLAEYVLSGDSSNREGQAAALYWRTLYGTTFTRDDTTPLNAALNYGYAILRGIIARDISATGFIPCFGLHHNNQLNAFNLADDLIEPFRPLADILVYQLHQDQRLADGLTPDIKAELLNILTQDVAYNQQQKNLLAVTLDVCRSLASAVENKDPKQFLPFTYG